ncbi:hypothetical protein ABE26_15545 [Cytobacillus firmus]|nr:hypothetical protein [Cytobacillus firmus]
MTLLLIFIIVVFSKYIAWWVKSVIVAYYIVVSYYFITVKNRIDKEFEGISPVPDAYWDQNSGWVDTIANYLFLPLAAILIFIYFNWFTKTHSKKAKIFILISLIPSSLLFMFFLILFSFAYGYRP